MGITTNNTVDLTPRKVVRKSRHWTMAEVQAARPMEARTDGDPTTVINIGSVVNRELPESGEIVTADLQTATLIYGGLYSALKAVIPTVGDTYEGYDGMGVNNSRLTRKAGNLGELRITLSQSSYNYFLTSDGIELNDRTEFAWQQIEKPLALHPYLDGYDDAPERLELWSNSEVKYRAQLQYIDADDQVQTLSGHEKDVAKKILKGIEAYVIYAPVIIRTREYQGRPNTMTKCGFIATLTGLPADFAEYEYLKTADSLSEQDNDLWVRREEWTGADQWDADLYTDGGGWNKVAAP